MNNLKKIGLSALAGSLVAISANAVEMGVSGTAEVTYTTKNGSGTGTSSDTGNPFGSNTSLSFSGSGDVGFGTAKIVRTIGDNMNDASTTASNEFLSAWQTVDAGDLGIFKFDSTGGAISGLRANRDKLPTAYEEVWTGVSSHGISSAGSDNVIGYSNSFGGITLDLAHLRGNSNGGTGDGGTGSISTGDATDFYLTANLGEIDASMEGLVIGGGYSDGNSSAAAVAGHLDADSSTTLIQANYSMGMVSVGYRFAEKRVGTQGNATKIADNSSTIDAFAVAVNVNDQLTVSYAQQDRDLHRVGTLADVTEDTTALNAAYTIGAASVRGTFAESDNAAGIKSDKDEHMEISLVLSF